MQVIHAFDLPARKDVSYSLVSGLTLISVGAVLSTSLWYGLFVLAFLICALGSLVQIQLSEAGERSGTEVSRSSGHWSLARGLVLPGFLAVVAVGVLAFSLIPQRQSINLAMMPTSAFQELRDNFSRDVQNPYYPQDRGDPFSKPPQNISPDSYHGFNPYMDLRSRGRLSDDVVMKVRSEEPVPYRGVAFDVYNGKGWETSFEEEDLETLNSDDPRFDLYRSENMEPLQGMTREVSQVFYVEQEAANVIFGAYRPETVFFPTSSISVGPYSSIRAPYPVPEGSTYSVISQVPASTPDQLRTATTSYPEEITDRYTPLPQDGLGRTRELAGELTAGTDNPYDAVVKMNEYLKTEYPYDLSIPPQRTDMDAVEYFLFEEQRGYCEQFSSSLAVMARTLGIPARVTTGYVSGEYNPFTGLYEVKASDAHAWIEVYFPGYGWSTFDPTPGFDSTPWQYEAAGNVQGGKVFGFLAERTSEALSPTLAATGTLMRGVARLDPVSIIISGALFGGIAMIVIYSRKYYAHRHRKASPQRSVKVSDTGIYSRYSRISVALEETGIKREPQETPEEYARRAAERLEAPEIMRLGEIYLYARFRDAVPAELAEEFDRLEPQVLKAIERQKKAAPATR